MPSAPYHLSISTPPVGALFASPLQRSDEPSAPQVRQAIATAIGAHGVRGCADMRTSTGTRRLDQNARICTVPGLPGLDREPAQIGGYLRGRAKTQVTLRDRPFVSLHPQLAEFAATDRLREHGRGLMPCPRDDPVRGHVSAVSEPYKAGLVLSDPRELAPWANVRRVIVIGPGAAGKSTLAVRLGEITGLPVIELDKLFWRPGLAATPRDQWAAIQRELASQESWIMDGDLGPYDVIEVRLQAADTVVFLDFSLLRCAWRAIRRSRERADFWWWLFSYRRRSRPLLAQAIAVHAGDADIHVLRTPRAVRRFVVGVVPGTLDHP